MLRSKAPWSVVGGLLLALGSVSAEATDFNTLLKGDFAFTGVTTCFTSFDGFDGNFIPIGTRTFASSSSVIGVRTFNGDGTGKARTTVAGVGLPSTTPTFFNPGGANSSTMDGDFTYEVNEDRTVVVRGPMSTGTILEGPRSGEQIRYDHVPELVGWISKDLRTIVVAHRRLQVETLTFLSEGLVLPRICYRTRVGIELKNR
ncbi:MAG: hypothetical protein HY726_20905 [Candidatus Rokubacteria bacterium]|nr:hypothetical protein [Deltaproteobacteria bacterium]MBI3077122.1 hypothetical protein [Deltaproteobacteria bacterium]MBI4611458.1 hypothetical protein [Candidatus Rokubacteria bacterium]